MGVAAAAGEIVAFTDDDAVPEAGWLEGLVEAYNSGDVGAVGGVAVSPFDAIVQSHLECDRFGRVVSQAALPPGGEATASDDGFASLVGVNMSFRREILVALGGFDEHLSYLGEDIDMCLRVLEAGLRIRVAERASVQHLFATSPWRGAGPAVVDPAPRIRAKAYFAIRHRAPTVSLVEAMDGIIGEARSMRESALGRQDISDSERRRYLERVDEGLALGVTRAIGEAPKTPAVPPPEPRSFVPIGGERRPTTVCLVGVERWAEEVAERAARGDDVHVFTCGQLEDALRLERGVWHHGVQTVDLGHPVLANAPEAADDLYAAVQMYRRVLALDRRVGVDILVCDADAPESALCRVAMPGDPAGRAPENLHGEVARRLRPALGLEPVDAARVATELVAFATGRPDELGDVDDLWRAPRLEFVERLYWLLVGRPVDPRARDSLLAALAAGAPRADLAAQLSASREARRRRRATEWTGESLDRARAAGMAGWIRAGWQLPDRAFVTVAYLAVLGREPDPPGLARYCEALTSASSLSRLDLVRALVESGEAGARAVPLDLVARLGDRV
jgi:hypothetical protein